MTENNSYTIETDNKEEKEEEEEGTSRKMTFQRLPLTRVFKILVTLTSIVTLLYIIKYRHCSTEIHSSNYETRLSDRFTKERYKKDGLLKNEDRHVKRKSTHFTYNEAKRRFRKYWVLHRDLRTNYRKILSPCQLYMTWKPHYPFKGPYTITSANNSFITLDIQPAGQFSTLNIDTYTLKNTRKRIGGDSWRIHVQGVTSVPVIVVDHNNGSYEASFLITEAGSYTISIHLDYTLCDGFKDPPPEWFIKGNAQGKYQPNSALPGYERPFLEDKFAYPLSFEVKRGNTSIFQHYKKNIHEFYDPKPCFSWDGFGQWYDDQTWKPYIPTPYKYKTDLNRTTGRGVFWIYGDSIGDFLYRSISKTALCSEVFNDCRRTYNWIYNIPNGNLKIATEENDDKDFNITRIESELLAVLNNEELDYSSAILLNYGLHFVQDIPFDRFKNMITRVIDILTDYMKRPNHAKVIWKTTTALQKWKYGHPSTNARHNVGIRFLTSQRVELFNALSTSRMCEAGIDVIDVYPMTYAFPNGTGSRKKFWDAVHYEPVVFKTLEEYINNFFNIGNYL